MPETTRHAHRKISRPAVRRIATRGLVVVLMLWLASDLAAQGIFGVLRGNVEDIDGIPLPGVTVDATSEVNLGLRSAITNAEGRWILRRLVPGHYKLEFWLEGFADTVWEDFPVGRGENATGPVTLDLGRDEETIYVTSEAPQVEVVNAESGTSFKLEALEWVDGARTLTGLVPGLSSFSPRDDRLSISGAERYDNRWRLDGLELVAGRGGAVEDLVLEEAVAEVSVATAGIGAEHGRFSGGVIELVTKIGGNALLGSYRLDHAPQDWRRRTPLERRGGVTLGDDVSETWQATLGGPIFKDRLWVFAAAGDEQRRRQGLLAGGTLSPRFDRSDTERHDLKLSASFREGKDLLQAQSLGRQGMASGPETTISASPRTSARSDDELAYHVLRHSGVLGQSLVLEAQGSWRTSDRLDMPSTTDSAKAFSLAGSPFLSIGFNGSPEVHYGAPFADSSDPREGEALQLAAKLGYFWGSHDSRLGFDFVDRRTRGGLSRSRNGFLVHADPLLDSEGALITDAEGRLIPTFVPGETFLERQTILRNAEISSELYSAYLQDTWQGERWTLHAGARWDGASIEAEGRESAIESGILAPRLGVSFGLLRDGRINLHATYGHYAGRYDEGLFAAGSSAGSQNAILARYTGPPGRGLDFAPGLDPAAYGEIFSAFVGRQNVHVDPGLEPPVVRELTLSVAARLFNGRGFCRVDLVARDTADRIEDFLCAGRDCPEPGDTGTTELSLEGVSLGSFEILQITNSPRPEARYRALRLNARYRAKDRWSIEGSWTWQLENEANFEGETALDPTPLSSLGDYPQVLDQGRYSPGGRAAGYQEHRARLWARYDWGEGWLEGWSLSLLARYDSGQVFDRRDLVAFNRQQLEALESYRSTPVPARQRLYFGPRGAGTFSDSTALDLSLGYRHDVAWPYDFELWFRAHISNVLAQETVIEHDVEIVAVADGPLDAEGLPTRFEPGPRFGRPLDNEDFVPPRELRLSAGIRF